MRYGEITLVAGPLAGHKVPTLGAPVYGYCLEVAYRTKKGKPRVAIYKTGATLGSSMTATADYVGTLR